MSCLESVNLIEHVHGAPKPKSQLPSHLLKKQVCLSVDSISSSESLKSVPISDKSSSLIALFAAAKQRNHPLSSLSPT
jgi:hypothetical protein